MAYLYDLTDTWNAAGTVFNAIKMNVTNTASAAGSKIVSLQVGATDRFTVDKDGNGYFSGTLQAVGSITAPNVYIGANSGTIGMQDNTASILAYNGTGSGGITNTLRFITGAAERVRIDGSGNVGIGTSSPSVKLDVSGGHIRMDDGYKLRWGDGTAAWEGSGASDVLIGYTNNTERMRIDSSGNVGIGTSSPASKLDVDGQTTLRASVNLTAGSFFAPNDNGLWMNGFATYGSGITSDAAGTAVRLWTSGSERARIDSSGNVGIGTSSPANILDIRRDTSGTQLRISTSDNGNIFTAGWETGASYVEAAGYNSPALAFKTGGSERMRIDTGGNMALGMTPSAWWGGRKAFQIGGGGTIGEVHLASSPGTANYLELGSNSYVDASVATKYISTGAATMYQQYNGAHNWYNAPSGSAGATVSWTQAMTLDASGNLLVGTTSNPSLARVRASNAGNDIFYAVQAAAGGYCYKSDAISNGGTYYHMEFLEAGTARGTITSNGSTVSYNTTSDYRLKDIVGPIQNSGAYIDSLKPVQGSWKADGSRFIGLIAHEVQEVSETQIATGVKDGDEMQAMDYSAPELIANLIAEIQSLRARVAQLEGN